jgi:hypothetical protein
MFMARKVEIQKNYRHAWKTQTVRPNMDVTYNW